ncbi:MAG: dienelactone hydrolase family protein [Thermoanaerobaculia bacterium]|nr:dienelactone hydrolase family protein [Thermoanaerobaculia bacterium]
MSEPTHVTIVSERGEIAGRFHAGAPAIVPRGAVLAVGGYTGGFEGPSGAYGVLGDTLPQRGIQLLRLDYRIKRAPGPVEEGTCDVAAGIDWLAGRGVEKIVAVGFSYGGALVVRAALDSASVVGVAALATQTAGIGDVRRLAPRPLLLVHGTADRTLPARLSRQVYERAGEPRELHLLDGAGHSMAERRDELLEILTGWIDGVLPARERRL